MPNVESMEKSAGDTAVFAAPVLSPLASLGPPPPKFGMFQPPTMINRVEKEWREVLRDCHYPADVLVVDFETYFDPDYHMGRDGKALSTIEYVQDKRFEILGCGFLLVRSGVNYPNYEGDTVFRVGEADVRSYLGWMQREFGTNLEGCTVVAQNAVFDCTVLARRLGILPPRIIDILGLARHWHSRSNNDLDALCKRHKLKQKGDTKEFSGATLRHRWYKPPGKKSLPIQRPLATDEQIVALSAYGGNDVAREWEVFTILLPKLSNPATELRLMNHTLNLYLHPTLGVDYARATDLQTQMQKKMNDAVAATGVTPDELSGDKSFARILDLALIQAGDDVARYYKRDKNGKAILAIAKTDDARSQLENHTSEAVRTLMAGRIALESWPKHVLRTRRFANMAKCDGNRLPISLKYCGAHTRRWSGGEKVNAQNLGSKGHELANAVREIIVAPPGQILAIVDAAQIEARGLAWIAGQTDLCRDFEETDQNPKAITDVYTKFASDVLGYQVRKPAKEGGIPEIERRMGWARNSVGKIGVLGCGYGMGATKAEALGEGKIDFEQAEKIVKTYRDKNRFITKFWRDIEKAFAYTAKYRKPCALARNLGFSSADSCDVIITLPSGGELKYHHVKLEAGQYGDVIKVFNDQEKKWEHTWGGSLTENVVQAISRDILGEAILRDETRGVRIALHCHDETIALGPEEAGPRMLAISIEELSRRPVWAPDWPLAAEGKLSKCYRK